MSEFTETPSLDNTAPFPPRQPSNYTTLQNKGTCFAHAAARMIARMIKMQFREHFPTQNESCSYYYNTLECNDGAKTIFDCFINNKNKPGCNDEELNSALLFYYIYSSITDIFGCDGAFTITTVEYFLLHLIHQDITIENIETKLKYDKSKYTDAVKESFNDKIKILYEVLIKCKESYKQHSPTIYLYPIFGIKSNSTDFIELLRFVIEKGFYANLTGNTGRRVHSAHSLLITGLERNGTDEFLIIKNSWGDNEPSIPNMGIINNKINIKDLINSIDDDKKITYIAFLSPFELIESSREIFDKNKQNIYKGLLIAAVLSGVSDIFNQIISTGDLEIINARDTFGYTALQWAVTRGRTEMAKAIIAVPGVDVHAKNMYGDTVIINAILKENIEITQSLVEKDRDIVKDPMVAERINKILVIAARDLESKIVESIMIIPGIDVNAINDNGSTPLTLAAFNRYFPSSRRGASKIKLTSNPDLDTVNAILKFPNVDINAVNKDGRSPLIMAVIGENVVVIKRLLEVPSIDVNARDKEGKTAFLLAAQYARSKDDEILKILLAYPGIDINIKDNEGLSAADIADKTEVRDLIKQNPGYQSGGNRIYQSRKRLYKLNHSRRTVRNKGKHKKTSLKRKHNYVKRTRR
jgi:ankyrin repeat protein